MLILLPLKSVYADGCDHGYGKLTIIMATIMIVVMSIIYVYIYAKNKELLIKVIAFCLIFSLFVSLIMLHYIFLYIFPVSLFAFGINPIYSLIVLGLLTIIIYIKLPKKEKIVLKKVMSLFVILFLMTILFSNGNRISNFYTSVICEYSGGELGRYCDTLYCEMP